MNPTSLHPLQYIAIDRQKHRTMVVHTSSQLLAKPHTDTTVIQVYRPRLLAPMFFAPPMSAPIPAPAPDTADEAAAAAS